MSYSYKFKTNIYYDKIAKDLAGSEIGDVTQFLNELAEALKARHTPEEDQVIVMLPEDAFFGTLALGIQDAITNAQEKVKENTRIAFAQPTHEQIEEKIKELLNGGTDTSVDIPFDPDLVALPLEMRRAEQMSGIKSNPIECRSDLSREEHIKRTTDTLLRNTEIMLGDKQYRKQMGDPTV
jgi:hypothetical protein